MTEPLERDDLIGLLNRLGSESDEEVLEAAHQAHARITAASMTWEELLVPDHAAADSDDADEADDADASDDDGDAADDAASDDAADEAGEAGSEDPEDEPDEPPAETARKNAESLALIGKLLAKPAISNDLREELEDYKTDIAEGEFGQGDLKYLRAISKRLESA